MMTPEQMQNTMNFIVESHANAMIRMDRFDEELKEQRKEMARESAEFREATRKIEQLEKYIQDEQREAEAFKKLQEHDAK